MRIILTLFASAIFCTTNAQAPLPVDRLSYVQFQPFAATSILSDSNHSNQKWFVTKSVGMSTGFSFYNGGSATFLSVPVGLQLNHPLTNNVVAFAGIYAVPTLDRFSGTLGDPAQNKSYPGNFMSNSYHFGVHPMAQMGLMYVNDARTFSISGSIGVSSDSYPAYRSNRGNGKQ